MTFRFEVLLVSRSPGSGPVLAAVQMQRIDRELLETLWA